MSYSATELKAERSILRTMGVAATFKTYNGQTSELMVLPMDETSRMKAGDFRSRETSHVFETLAENVPPDWMDARLVVGTREFLVLDVRLDEYQTRARIEVE